MVAPSNWTQESSDALKALTRIAIFKAEYTPEKWVNPTPLNAKIRYIPPNSIDLMPKFELYGAHGGVEYNTWYFGFEEKAESLPRFLFNCWFNEICNSGNTKFVELLNRNYEIDLWTDFSAS